MSSEGVFRSSTRLGILILILLATAVTAGAGDSLGSFCSRELLRVLFGGAANLLSLFLSLVQWLPSYFPLHDIKPSSNPCPARASSAHKFVIYMLIIFSPQVCVAWVVTAAYAAMAMHQRLRTLTSNLSFDRGKIAKRICPLVVWIGIDKCMYNTLIMSCSMDHTIADKETAVRLVFGEQQYLDNAPNFKLAIPWPVGPESSPLQTTEDPLPGDCSLATGDLQQQKVEYAYLCLQGWDPRNAMWKEAMVATGALWEIDDSMEVIERGRPLWAGLLLVMQGVGFQASVASRLVNGLEVSPVEMVSVWMSLFVVVEAGIMPFFVIPSNRGICVHLSTSKFDEVIKYYVDMRHTHAEGDKREELNCFNLWSFVLCILFIFFMFLILIPPLLYYYHRLPDSSLSFASLIPFTLLSVAGIVAFAISLFLPPYDVLFAFTTVPPWPHSSKHIFAITVAFLVTGLASYVFAIIETYMHWSRFQVADPSFFRFIIPHIGA